MGKITLLILNVNSNTYIDCYVSIRKYYPDIQIITINAEDLGSYLDDINLNNVSINEDDLSKRKKIGIESINTDYTVLLDNDSIFTEDTKLDNLFDQLTNEYMVCGGLILFENLQQKTEVWSGKIEIKDDHFYINKSYTSYDTDMVHLFYMISTKLLQEYIVEEGFSYIEDHINNCLLWKNNGIKIRWESSCVLSHKEANKKVFRYNFRPFVKNLEKKYNFTYHTLLPIKFESTKKIEVVSPITQQIAPVSVVIPCHNYARYLKECVNSLYDQFFRPSQIIVIDDNSTDNINEVCSTLDGIDLYKCNFKDVHKVRKFGLEYVKERYVCFLDADDKLPKQYFKESVDIFDSNTRIAITYPRLEYFDGKSGTAYNTENAPDTLTSDDLECRNWIPAGSVYRTGILRQSEAFNRGDIDPSKSWCQDWIIAREVLRSGSWIAKKMQTPLMYRAHNLNMSSKRSESYWEEANLENEIITMVIAFSGRWRCWDKMLQWIKTQSWPVDKLRLMILNNTHNILTTNILGLSDWRSSIQIETCNLGYSNLKDENRVGSLAVQDSVNMVVGQSYNIATTMSRTEFMFFLEDDVIPHDPNCIEKLMKSIGHNVVGVSGIYPTRYDNQVTCAVKDLTNYKFMPLIGEGVQPVAMTGFGCLLTRRSFLRKYPLVTDGKHKWYDVNFFTESQPSQILLDYSVSCDHLV